MNHCSSPIAQTNEVARNQVQEPDSNQSNNGKRPAYESKYLLAEELQKIRRSNHSSHHARREVMDDNDDDHDDFIKGLMYPALENPMDGDTDFFEEDLDEELLAMNGSMDLTNALSNAPPNVPPVASYPNTSNSNPMYSEESRLQADYYCNYYSSYYPRPRDDYPDLGNQKLRR